MELTPDIRQMYRVKYETKWERALQQDVSFVAPYVTIHPNCRGKSVSLPYHGKTKMKEYTDRLTKIEHSGLDFGQRHIKKRKFYNSTPLSIDDKLDMDTLDLTSADVMEEQRSAVQRMHDEVILGVMEDNSGGYRIRTQADGVCGGIFGPNYTGENADVIETLDQSAGSNQVIPVDFAFKGTKTIAGMLMDKIAELKCRYQIMNAWKAGKGEIIIGISPRIHAEMLLWEQAMNKNYGFSSLTNGELNEFLGVRFLVTNMLPLDDDGNRLCVAWLKSRVKFGIWRDTSFRIEPRPEYVDLREQITVTAALGSSRLDNKTVFLMPCKESTASAA